MRHLESVRETGAIEMIIENILLVKVENSLVLLLGSRGPSTVTLMALAYTPTCGGFVLTVIVSEKLLPEIENNVNVRYYLFNYFMFLVFSCFVRNFVLI